MDNVVYLKEVLIRKELTKAEQTLSTARRLVSEGVYVPIATLDRLQQIIDGLEIELENYILSK